MGAMALYTLSLLTITLCTLSFTHGAPLPACPKGTNLLTEGVPKWKSEPKTAQEKAHDPFSLVAIALGNYAFSDAVPAMNGCMAPWGLTEPVKKIASRVSHTPFSRLNTMVAFIMRAGDNIFITYRGMDTDWVLNIFCGQTGDESAEFGQKDADIRMLASDFIAYKASIDSIEAYLNNVSQDPANANVSLYLVGHSLGASLAPMTALHMVTKYPFWEERLQGVITLGGNRLGNQNWKAWYNYKLGAQTLRLVNYRDIVPTLIKGTIKRSTASSMERTCLKPGQSYLHFRFVGDTVLLCPSPTAPGLQELTVVPYSEDAANPNSLDEAQACDSESPNWFSHLASNYIDSWRRAALAVPELGDMRNSRQVLGIMCDTCNKIGGGPVYSILPSFPVARSNPFTVTCISNQTCRNKVTYEAAARVGDNYIIKPFNPTSRCVTGVNGLGTYTCT